MLKPKYTTAEITTSTAVTVKQKEKKATNPNKRTDAPQRVTFNNTQHQDQYDD